MNEVRGRTRTLRHLHRLPYAAEDSRPPASGESQRWGIPRADASSGASNDPPSGRLSQCALGRGTITNLPRTGWSPSFLQTLSEANTMTIQIISDSTSRKLHRDRLRVRRRRWDPRLEALEARHLLSYSFVS